MTVIAYRDGVMASDSGASYANTYAHDVRKVVKIYGHLIGISGTAAICVEFLDWFERECLIGLKPVPKFERIIEESDGVWALIVTPENNVYRVEKFGSFIPVQGKFHAAGSGMDFALAAMEMGATAAEAIAIAIKYDAGSIGTVMEVAIDG